MESKILHPNETQAIEDFSKGPNFEELIKVRPEVTKIEAKLIKHYIENIIDNEMSNIYILWQSEPDRTKREKLWWYHNALHEVRNGLLNKLPINQEEKEDE